MTSRFSRLPRWTRPAATARIALAAALIAAGAARAEEAPHQDALPTASAQIPETTASKTVSPATQVDTATEAAPAAARQTTTFAAEPAAAETTASVPAQAITPDPLPSREQAGTPAAEPAAPKAAEAAPLPAAAPAPIVAVPAPSIPDPQASIAAAARDDAVKAAVASTLASPDFAWPKRLPKQVREKLQQIYAANGNVPLWLNGEAWSGAGLSIAGRLARVAEDGLDPESYIPPSTRYRAGTDRIRALAEADISLSALAVLYARDARGGRVNPTSLSKLITPVLDLPDADTVIAKLRAAADPDAALEAYNPSTPGYLALKAKLAAVRAAHPVEVSRVRVPQGMPLSIGMKDPRVPLVRARFGLGPVGDEPTTYDTRLASAVADFQKDNGLEPSGVLTRETTAALAATQRLPRESDILVNMERWRWLPTDLGERYILVNIPEFTLRVIEDGKVAHQARVIVGKPDSPTPLFSHQMEYAVVNPSWHIPPSILRNEFLPALAQNPNYAAERGYIVERRGNNISIRQPPGERNALGFIKFMFPNQHAVYIHDTPGRALFGRSQRALSHGCVRVENPFRLADFVFQGEWGEARLKAMIGKGERTIRLKTPLPVHLAYFTLSVDPDGRVDSRDDLYGIDAKLKAALGLKG